MTNSTLAMKYEQLSDRAKEKARSWWRDASSGDSDWADFIIEDFEDVAALLGFSIERHHWNKKPAVEWDLGHGGDAAFAGFYISTPHAARSIMEHAPQDEELHRIAVELEVITITSAQPISARITKYRGSMTVEVDDADDDADADKFRELVDDLAKWLHASLKAEQEYIDSDEYIAETIVANEYDFDEDGNRI